MVFREKTAWLMLIITLVVGGYIASEVLSHYWHLQQMPPVLPVFIKLTAMLISLSIIGQIVLTIFNARQAEQEAAEREKYTINKARATAGVILAIGIVLSFLQFIVIDNGDVLFYACLFSLVAAQLVEYSIQIVRFRKS